VGDEFTCPYFIERKYIMADKQTNLHPKNDSGTNLKPNIITENIPDKAVTMEKLDQNLQDTLRSNTSSIDKLNAGIYDQAFKRNILFDTKTIDKPFQETNLIPYTNNEGKLTFSNNLGSLTFINLNSTIDLYYVPGVDVVFHFNISYVEKTTCKIIMHVFNTDGTSRYVQVDSSLRVGESELSVNCNSNSGKEFDHATIILQLTGAITFDYIEVYQFSGKTEHIPVQTYLEKLTKTEQGQNLFLYDSAESIPYHSYGNGGDLNYTSDVYERVMLRYIPVVGGHRYSACNFRKDLHNIWYYLQANWVFYDDDKKYISFYHGDLNNYKVPDNAAFMRFSLSISNYHLGDPQYVILIREGKISGIDEYLPAVQNQVDYSRIGKPLVTRITVGKNDSGNYDFTSVREALESITDSSETHLYEVLVSEGTYELADDYSDDEKNADDWAGLFMPDFTKLIGVGNKKKVVIKLTLGTPKTYPSALNLRENCEIENITFDSTNCRYTIHDDWADDQTISHRKRIRNCIFKCTDSSISTCYGVGVTANADWEFDNCLFELTHQGGGIAMYMHNHDSFRQIPRASNVTFRNCRFLVNGQPSQYLLNTISSPQPGTCSAHFYGCRLGDLKLIANDGSTGCYWYADGFGNQMGSVTITSNDDKDYSDQVNFI
jgi:hypothetical protein